MTEEELKQHKKRLIDAWRMEYHAILSGDNEEIADAELWSKEIEKLFQQHTTKANAECLTGQEWYDRFVKAFTDIRIEGDPKAKVGIEQVNELLEKTIKVAKKASGIE